MKLTTGFDFQGYFITEYIDVIFDEMLVGIGLGKGIISTIDNMFSSLTGSEATAMIDKLNDVKSELRDRVIKKAQKLGANALIGIDFESSKLGDLIMVSMTATAVKVDKIVSPLPTTQQEIEFAKEKEREAKLAEEKENRMKHLREQQKEFDVPSFMQALEQMETSRERGEYIKQLASVHPNLFTDEILQKVENSISIERMYGRGAGWRGLSKALKEYFGIA